MSKEERLNKLRALQKPVEVALEVLDSRVTNIESTDFLTQEDIQTIIDSVRSLVKDGESIVGPQGEPGESIVGPQGEPGRDGDSVVGPQGEPGKDGRDGETPNFDKIVKEVLKLIPKAKDGMSPDIKDVVKQAVDELKKVPCSDGLRLTALEKRLIRLGGGGASYLSQLLDVVLTNLTNGQVIAWDATLQKFTNQTNAAGSGINRMIFSVAVDTLAGSAALTDYVYFVSGTTTITLPAALGNGNRYTIKRVGVGTVTIATTGGATIDGSATAPLYIQYESLDLISDGSNWNVV